MSKQLSIKDTNLSICPFRYKKILIPDIKLHSWLQIIPLDISYNFYYARIALYLLFMLFIPLSYVFLLYNCA